jgi:selenium-binding protein 1
LTYQVHHSKLDVWGSQNNYCFTTTALTSQIWLIYEKDNEWHTESVGTIGDPAKIPLPVDISITADDKHLWVNTWNDGMTRVFDISDPHNAKEVYTHKIGDQVNMLSQSWDGKRVYFTSSLLANWDKADGPEKMPQFFKAYHYKDGKLEFQWSLDFAKEKLGMPHQMRFGAYSLYSKSPKGGAKVAELSK